MDSTRARLDEQEQQTLGRLRNLTDDFDAVVAASRDTNADDEHDPEGQTIAFERSQVDALIRAARRQLEEIEAARWRLGDGSYSVCERCGGATGEARLAARPTARHCVECASTTAR